MLDYRMDTLLTVCQYMNFTRASEVLHLAQSTVSLHIRSLEEHYHTKIFTFQGKKMELTQTGQMILELAKSQKQDEERLHTKIQSTHHPIRLGTTLSVAEHLLTKPMAAYLKGHRENNIYMDMDNTEHLLDKLREGWLDAAFVEGQFPAQEFDFIPCHREPFIGVCASFDQTVQGASTLQELAPCTLLLRERGSGSREILEELLRKYGMSPQNFARSLEIGSIHLIIELVKEGVGVAFLYQSTIQEALSQGSVRQIPLKEDPISHEISYLWRRNSLYTQEYRTLGEEFVRCIQRLEREGEKGQD